MKKILLLTLFILFAFLAGKFYYISGDDGTYIAIARSMHLGEYAAINIPEELPQIQYPPLYPLLIYPFAELIPSNLGVIRLWNAILSLLAVVAITAIAIRRDPALGAVAALPFILNPLFGEYATSIMPEPLFVALCYAVVLRIAIADENANSRIDLFIPAGILAAILLKPAALPLFLTAIFWFAIKKRWRQFAYTALIVILGMLPWLLWQSSHGSDYIRSHIFQRDIYDPSKGSISFFEIIYTRIPYNALRYIGRIFADVMLPPFFRSILPRSSLFIFKIAGSVGLFLLFIFGFYKKVRKKSIEVEDIFLFFMGLQYLIHPVFADRYLFTLLPTLTGYTLLAISNSKHRAAAAIIWSAILLLGSIMSIETAIPKEEAAYIETIEWLKENSKEGDLVIARKPTAVWFYTNRKAKGYPASSNWLDWDTRARFIIRDAFVIGVPASRLYVDPVVNDTSLFSPVFVSGILHEVKVYEKRF